MRPIWYFVGLLLLIIGVIVAITGVYLVIEPGEHQTVLSELHPNIWWGTIMSVAGAIFLWKNKNVKIQ